MLDDDDDAVAALPIIAYVMETTKRMRADNGIARMVSQMMGFTWRYMSWTQIMAAATEDRQVSRIQPMFEEIAQYAEAKSDG